MKTIFEPIRFFKFLKVETIINKNNIIKILLGYLVVSLIIYYFFYFQNFPNIINPYLGVLKYIIVIIPIVLYKNLYHKVKSIDFVMLPASRLEKFISAIILTNIIVPFILIISFIILLTIFNLINPFVNDIKFSDFMQDIFHGLQMQSFLFLAYFWFKNNKIIKVIITIIIISVFFSILGYILINTNFVPQFSQFLNNNHNIRDFISFITDNYKIILAILFPIVPWFVAYKKYIKTQI